MDLPMIWIVQGWYVDGWEDITASEIEGEAIEDLRRYRLDGRGVYRIIRRRQREGE